MVGMFSMMNDDAGIIGNKSIIDVVMQDYRD